MTHSISIAERIEFITSRLYRVVPMMQQSFHADEDQQLTCNTKVKKTIRSLGSAVELLTYGIRLSGRDGAETAARAVENSYRCMLEAADASYETTKHEFDELFTSLDTFVMFLNMTQDYFAETPKDGDMPQEEDGQLQNEKRERNTAFEKIVAIAKYLKAKPNATSKEIEEATGIIDSEVRRLWVPIKESLKEAKRDKPSGWKENGKTEGYDDSAECSICQTPLSKSFECKLCEKVIVGECKECHYTNTHRDDAFP